MTPTNQFFRSLDKNVWLRVEKMAYKHPNKSKLLAIPLAIGTYFRDVVRNPLLCCEAIILSGISFRDYLSKPTLLNHQRFASHSGNIFSHAFKIPFSFLIGTIDAIVTFVKVLFFPYKYAKINAAKQDLSNFIEEQKYTSKEYLIDKTIVSFVDEKKFVAVAFNRFTKAVMDSPTTQAVSQHHFIDRESDKIELINEISLKQRKFEESAVTYHDRYKTLSITHTPESEELKLRLNELWKKFQTILILATKEEAANMIFNI